METTDYKIDFVMIWVDGNDPKWQAEKRKYEPDSDRGDDSVVRYRDWDNLQYWFRGVEKYAPWVNKIHFVTWGHLPAWLDTTNPKLHIVNHRDYIPAQYLPTFNSHTIELNLHRIEGLAEHFVYFNDDTFLMRPVTPEYFFQKGHPRDTYALNAIYFASDSAGFFNANDVQIINDNFDKKQVMKRDWKKWFHPANSHRLLVKTFLLSFWPWFPGFYYAHLPNNYLKSTFEKVWAAAGEALDSTCHDRFRTKNNCNQWVMKYWQLAEGICVPKERKSGYNFNLRDFNFMDCVHAIESQKLTLLCINDTVSITGFEEKKAAILTAFASILPDKSSFEK